MRANMKGRGGMPYRKEYSLREKEKKVIYSN
jgi:hypothetical protein